MKEIKKAIAHIITEVTGKVINQDMERLSWRELGIDSLDLLDIITRCEVQFQIKITDSEASKMFTPNDTDKLVNNKVT